MYQSFYNLSGKPFRLSPDPAFFFPSRGHKRALAYLRYGLHQNEGFVVITGAPGTGKTTLAQILLNEMNEKNVVVAHLTTTQLEADDMLRMVSASFGLRYENLDKAALLKGIESYLLSRSRENKRALLVIDEAQNLPMRSLEELRMLSNLQVGDKALLQTFLLGQVQFRTMLEDKDLEQLRQRVIANFHLGPLAADESQRYIESRLKHVGWDDDPAFAEIAFEKIHEYTEGVPRRINMLCDRILLYGCMEEQHNITGEVVDEVRAELEQEVGAASDAVKSSSDADSEGKKNTSANKISKPNNTTAKSDKSSASQSNASPSKTQNRKTAKAQPAESSNTKGSVSIRAQNKTNTERAEPQFPADLSDAIDSESEQYIDITQDFIDKFDASLTKSRADIQKEESTGSSNKPANRQAKSEAKKPELKKPEQSEESRKEKARVESSQDEDTSANETDEQDVLGNTVKRKNPAITQSDDDSGHFDVNTEPAQISERDLFRVIPGGKDNHTEKPQEQPATEEFQAPAVPPAASATPTSEDVVLRRILRLVLAFHRSPSSFPGLDDPSQPLPEGVSELLELAVADDEVLTKVSPAAVMGISPVMLRASVRFFIRRTLFANDSDHYRMLGLTSGADISDIERHYDLLMRLLRQDKQPGAAECVDKVGRSYEILMRLDDSPQVPVSPPRNAAVNAQQSTHREKTALEQGTKNSNSDSASSRATSPDDDKKAAAVLEALENPELTIDFSDDEQNTYQAKPKPVSSFVGYGKDQYIPDPRITRRRIHLLGQAAILGIGALVVVLGIFITQLEPDSGKNVEPEQQQVASIDKPVAPEAKASAEKSEEGNERRLGLSFNDGTSGESKESFSAPGTRESKPTRVFDDRSGSKTQSASAGNESMSQESRASGATTRSKVTSTVSTAEPEVSKTPKAPQVAASTVPVKPRTESTTRTVNEPVKTVSESASKFQQVPINTKNESTSTPSATQGTEQAGKFTAVPIAQKGAESAITSSSAESVSQPASNQFPGKDIPVSPANVTATTSSTTSRQSGTITPVSPAPISPANISGTTGTATSQSPTAMSPIEAALSDSEGGATASEPSATTTASTIRPATGNPALTINDFQLEQLLSKFAGAYNKGNLNGLMALFANDSRTNTQTTKAGIEREYRELFSSTATRNLTLIKPLWNNEGRFARGVGQYSTTIVPQGGEAYTSNGKYTIQAYLEGNRVIISRFYFSNELTINRKQAQAGSPGHAELKGMLTQFTQYYEAGDTEKLMTLFASNAQTNDQNTLAGIRKDHDDLFKSTEQRQIFLKDVKWQINGKLATGKGNFEVMVQSKGQDSFASVTGTITIEAEKSNNSLKITKFLHKTN